VADLSTLVPGGNTNFLAFGKVAIEPSHVVFYAESSPDNGHTVVQGLYTNLTAVSKISRKCVAESCTPPRAD
jgi:hypothetical protein